MLMVTARIVNAYFNILLGYNAPEDPPAWLLYLISEAGLYLATK